jgi:hypothetical protein
MPPVQARMRANMRAGVRCLERSRDTFDAAIAVAVHAATFRLAAHLRLRWTTAKGCEIIMIVLGGSMFLRFGRSSWLTQDHFPSKN